MLTSSLRGKPWQLHRRLVAENSAIVRKFDELFPSKDPTTKKWNPDHSASPQLFSIFLDQDQSQTKQAGEKLTLSFAADICIRSTEYQVDGAFFFKNHYEGGYLFRDMITLEATPPGIDDPWKIRYHFENQRAGGWQDANTTDTPDLLTFVIPFEQPTAPGISRSFARRDPILESVAVNACENDEGQDLVHRAAILLFVPTASGQTRYLHVSQMDKRIK